jgi:hypothetical protein
LETNKQGDWDNWDSLGDRLNIHVRAISSYIPSSLFKYSIECVNKKP